MNKGTDKLIVALDVDTLDAAKKIVDTLYPAVKIFKIGSQLFTNAGPSVVEYAVNKGARVFLDLKFHDIPNTVAGAARAAVKLKVFMFNVHVQGGFDMMKRTMLAVEEEADKLKIQRPLVLGVTVLTSMGEKDLRDLEIKKGVKSQVTYLARLARDAGLDGVVASADEVQPIRWSCGDDFVIVTPGIRPALASECVDDRLDTAGKPKWAGKDDQKRTATPKEAISLGANYIVVGRPILEAKDPKVATEKILSEINDKP